MGQARGHTMPGEGQGQARGHTMLLLTFCSLHLPPAEVKALKMKVSILVFLWLALYAPGSLFSPIPHTFCLALICLKFASQPF